MSCGIIGMPHLKMSLYSHHFTHCEDVAVDVEAHVEACEGDAISAVGIVLVAGTRIFCKNADQGRSFLFGDQGKKLRRKDDIQFFRMNVFGKAAGGIRVAVRIWNIRFDIIYRSTV